MNWYNIFITVIAILYGIALFLFMKEKNKRATEHLTLELEKLRLQKVEYILKELGTVDYLTKYFALYEAGFVDVEIKFYIGNN